ncbi:hypothetical protein, partial [Nocardia gipuzkoensis]
CRHHATFPLTIQSANQAGNTLKSTVPSYPTHTRYGGNTYGCSHSGFLKKGVKLACDARYSGTAGRTCRSCGRAGRMDTSFDAVGISAVQDVPLRPR